MVRRGGIVKVISPGLAGPWLQPLLVSLAVISGKPMAWRVGRKTCWMYSNEGEPETFVPPVTVRRTGISEGNVENKMYGSVAWRVSAVLPTVSQSTWKALGAISKCFSKYDNLRRGGRLRSLRDLFLCSHYQLLHERAAQGKLSEK